MPSNPYVGPKPYEKGQKLYGRDPESIEIQNLVIGERLVMLYSPSGAGKTSLVQASVIDRLEKKRFQVLPVIRMNRESAGVRPLNRFAMSVFLSLEPQGVDLQPLNDLDLASYFRQRQRVHGASKTLLIFDQFEEILTTDPSNHQIKEDFFQQLGDLLSDKRLFALFLLREDYVGELEPFLRPLPTRLATRFRLDLLDKKHAIESIRGPVVDQHCEFDLDAAAELSQNLSRVRRQTSAGVHEDAGIVVEPVVLQVVCTRLWENMEKAQKSSISLADVAGVGDVDQSLAEFYGNRVADVARETRTSEQMIRRWCEQVLITEQGIRGQVLETPEMTKGLPNEVIGKLERAHIIRPEPRRGETWLELAHDRLIEPIRRSNADWLVKQMPIVQAAEAWERNSGDQNYLCVGEQLREFKRLLGAEPPDATVQRFLDACEAAQSDRDDKDRLERQQQKLLTWIAVVLGAALFPLLPLLVEMGLSNAALLAGVAAFFAFRSLCIGAMLGFGLITAYRVLSRTSQMLARFTRKHRRDRSLHNSTQASPTTRKQAPRMDGSSARASRTIQFAPFWIFMIMAGADGVFTAIELWIFRRGLRIIRSRAQKSGAAYRTLFPASKRDLQELLDAFFADPRDAVDGLREAAAILNSEFWASDGAQVRQSLLEIAKRMARFDRGVGDGTHYSFIEKTLEGLILDPKSVRNLYYRKSGLATIEGVFKASVKSLFYSAVIGVGFWTLVRFFTPSGPASNKLADGAKDLPGFVQLWIVFVFLLPPLIAGVGISASTKSALRSAKIRNAVVGAILTLLSAMLACLIGYGFSTKENAWLWFVYSVILVVGVWLNRPTNRDIPFCEACERWCAEQPDSLVLMPIGIENQDADDLQDLQTRLENGQMEALDSLIVDPGYSQKHRHWWTLTLESCPGCKELNTLTITRFQVRKAKADRKPGSRYGCLISLLGSIPPIKLIMCIISWFRPKEEDEEDDEPQTKILIDRLLISALDAQLIRERAERLKPPASPNATAV